MVQELIRVTNWSRALKAARRTQGKEDNNKTPSRSWVAKMLLAEHSPIRLVEFEWVWPSIKQWITVHIVRHFLGCEKFVHSQRPDRRELQVDRDALPQGSENDMMMAANAQALINISRKRLCSCASTETREKWQEVKNEIEKIDPVMASRMVPECQYRGFCPEFAKDNCGFFMSPTYVKQRLDYCNKCNDQEWRQMDDTNWMSNNGVVVPSDIYEQKKDYVYFKDSPYQYEWFNNNIIVRIGDEKIPVVDTMRWLFAMRPCVLKNRNPFDLSITNVSE